MKFHRPLLLMRVDTLPAVWYAGTDAEGAPQITRSRDYALRIQEMDSARETVRWLRETVGGVWSIVSDRVLM